MPPSSEQLRSESPPGANTLLPRFWARTRWEPEDPIRRVARVVAIPTSVIVMCVGAIAGNVGVILAGAALLLRVAMAAPKR
jgi:hypothetical protein